MAYEVTFQVGALTYTARGADTAGLLALIQGLQGTESVPEHELRRDAAEATLKRLKYEWRGGVLWAPPIGAKPAFLDDIRPGWIDWPGGDRPEPAATIVEVELRGGLTNKACAQAFTWDHLCGDGDIVRYRVCE